MLEFLSIGSHTSKRCPAKKQKVEVGTFANLPPFSVQSAAAASPAAASPAVAAGGGGGSLGGGSGGGAAGVGGSGDVSARATDLCGPDDLKPSSTRAPVVCGEHEIDLSPILR